MGSLPVDSRGWVNDYGRFSNVLSQAAVADDIQIAIEYHVSPIGRSRIDVLLAGSDGRRLAELRFLDEVQRRRLAKALTDVLSRS